MDSLEELYTTRIDEDDYYEAPRPRKETPKVVSRANTYVQLLVEAYEPYLNWTNETLFKDRALLYMKANQLVNKKSDSALKGILDWCKGKRLHPLAVVKIINKALIQCSHTYKSTENNID